MMRCDDVRREVSSPSEGRDELALSQHLENCESCAKWAEQASHLDRLWDATRPAEPAPERWSGIWSAIVAGLDEGNGTGRLLNGSAHLHGRAGMTTPSHSSPTRRWRKAAVIGLVGLAQAAALLLAIRLSWDSHTSAVPSPRSTPAPALAQRTLPSLDSVVDVEDGQVVYIRSVGASVQIIDLAAIETVNGMSLEAANGEDPWFVFFNIVEPGQMVAMQ